MENNIFIFTNKDEDLEIERFHICAWEFKNNSTLMELGMEIKKHDFDKDQIDVKIFVPWIDENDKIVDLYDKLKDPENSKFIFNDAVIKSEYVNHDQIKYGTVLHFHGKNPLCIMPIEYKIKNKVINIKIKTGCFKEKFPNDDINMYFRFYMEPDIRKISTRKSGISKTSIIYDLKVNEKRNLPDIIDIGEVNLCRISKCFLLNILPNSFDLSFYDANHLKSVRTLEYESFKKYLGDSRVSKDELMVVFNKREGLDSYAFFTKYLKERIGAGQFALAVLVNILCGILLYLPSFRQYKDIPPFSKQMFLSLPLEVYISFSIGFLIIIYFIWPKITGIFKLITSFGKKK